MTTETILQFFFRYNSVLVESLVVLILLFASLLTFRSFKQSKDEGSGGGGGADLSQIEESLKKILERANSVPAAAAVATATAGRGPSGESSPALTHEINTLKEELRKKQLEIEEARAAASSVASSGGMSEAEKANLELKIGDLERKLSEFDIISQDIADLTKYRDENIKLKEELESIKKGGGAPASTPAAVAPTPEPVASPAPAPTPAAAPASAAATPSTAPTHDPMEDLFNPPTAADPVAVEPAAPTPPAAATPEAAAQMMEVPPVDEPGKIDSSNVVDDDLMAEFAAALAEQSGTPATPKVAPEQQAAPPAPPPPPVEPPVTPQDKELIGQFENFVNKDDKSEPAKGS